MRIPALFTFLLLATALPVVADDAADVAAFNTAWQAYVAARESGDNAAQLAAAKQAVETGRKVFDEHDEELPMVLSNYGILLLKGGQVEEAGTILEEALDDAEAVYGKRSAKLIVYLENHANALGMAHADARQLAQYRRALKIAKAHLGEDSLQYGKLAYRAGVSGMSVGELNEGRRYLERAKAVFDNNPGADAIQRTLTEFWLGKAELAAHHLEQATRLLLASLEGFKAADVSMTAYEMETHKLLVNAYERQELSDAATEHCLAIGAGQPLREGDDFVPLFVAAPAGPPRDQGSVELKFVVDKNGFVRDPVVVDRDGGPSLDAPALAAVKRFRYAPRFENGIPVATSDVRTRITFRIE